jgi:hypothetical protein
MRLKGRKDKATEKKTRLLIEVTPDAAVALFKPFMYGDVCFAPRLLGEVCLFSLKHSVPRNGVSKM